MAWNEPGNNKPQDPWGGGDQGPPDLDEALKKFQQRMQGIFGGSGGGTGVGGSSIFIVLLVLAGIWAASGFYKVDEQEEAVVLRLGKFHAIEKPGLRWYPRFIETYTKVKVTTEQEVTSRGLMLTEDENIVELPLTVQFNIKNSKDFVLNVRRPEVTLQHATDSALRHVVGSSSFDQTLGEGRQEIGDEVKLRLQKYLDSYGTGIRIVKVNIKEGKPPVAVKAAFDDVINAKEDKDRLQNEAQAYANGIIPEARGRAQRMIEEANGYKASVVSRSEGEAMRFEKLLTEYQKAPEVTRERLYLDAVQAVMENSSKIMVDVEGGNNMMYLPLDQLRQVGGRSSGMTAGELQRIIAKEVDNQVRQYAPKTRRAEGR